MENGTLFSKLQDKKKPLTWKQRANIAVGIARGLYHLHSNNVVHGDIKGQNILLDKHLEAKIGDFGSNRLLYSLEGNTMTHIRVLRMPGTPYYLPNWYVVGLGPQLGRIVRKQIDVYSFGMVLLEIMSGKLSGNFTLRNFVDADIKRLSEPPEEYIAPGDGEKRRFTIEVEDEEDGSRYESEVDWAKLMFDIGRQCTIYDQTPWREPLIDPTPWETMKQNDITMERIFETLESCYISYLDGLGEEVDKNKSELNACGVITSRVMQDGFVPNQPENMDT